MMVLCCPPDMEICTISEGLYAVILLQGIHSEALKILLNFYQTWLTQSTHTVDDRSYFEIMGEKYHPLSPDSEEEAWIPIRLKF
jgi:predicted transcriptional regulator YdeE